MLKVLSGNKAAAYAAKLAKVEVAAVYPITPQTQISEEVSKFVADGKLDCDIIEVEGEHSVMSAITGAAVAGARVFTATSSLGLAYMNEPTAISGSRPRAAPTAAKPAAIIFQRRSRMPPSVSATAVRMGGRLPASAGVRKSCCVL